MTAPEETPGGRPSPVPLAVFFYASLFGASLLWVAVRGRWEPLLAVAAGTWGILRATLAGVLIATIVVALSIFLEKRSNYASSLRRLVESLWKYL